MTDPANLRVEYRMAALSINEVAKDPFIQFGRWFTDAQNAEIVEPNAMVLVTVDGDGQPSSRTVLLKALDPRGFTFFTNYESRKARDLASNPRAALTFFWKELERQVHIRGVVEKVTREESAAYFATRPYGSQIGAHASMQSSEISSRGWLEGRFAELEAEYPPGRVPLPEQWGGFRLIPEVLEFWQGRSSRLHDRIFYERLGDGWRKARLSP